MKEKLDNEICKECKSYWSNKAAKNRHAKCHKENSNSEEEQESSMGESEEDTSSDEDWDEDLPEENDAQGGSIARDERMPVSLTISLTFYKDHSPTFRFYSLTFFSTLYNFFFVQIACFKSI